MPKTEKTPSDRLRDHASWQRLLAGQAGDRALYALKRGQAATVVKRLAVQAVRKAELATALELSATALDATTEPR
ncbi:MAG: hypothetical protein AB7Q16_23995 [Vicinamibacterales bacterium]